MADAVNKVNKKTKKNVPAQTAGQQVNIRKSKKGIIGKVIAFIVIFVVLAAFAACFWFDVGAIRTKTADFLMPGATVSKREVEYNESIKSIETQQTHILEEKKALDVRESELDAREAAVAAKEAELNLISENVTEKQTEFENKERSVRDVAKIYEDMDADVAAKILMRYDDKNEVAQIVKNLSDEKAADILSEMDTSYAMGLLRVVNASNTANNTNTGNTASTDTKAEAD